MFKRCPVFNEMKYSCRSFMNHLSASSEKPYFILFGFYMASLYLLSIGWKTEIYSIIWNVHLIFYAVVMWGSAIYLFKEIIDWRKAWNCTGFIVITGLIVFLLFGLLSRFLTSDSYKYIMGMLFCVMACGKRYQILLKNYIVFLSATLLFGLIFLWLGFTNDVVKPEREVGGHSLGIVYPNNWGYLAFALMLLIWYLFLKNRKILSLVLFFALAVFMYKYITCRTIAGLAILFPFLGVFAEWRQVSVGSVCSLTIDSKNKLNTVVKKSLYWFLILLPFIFFGMMLFIGWQMEWVRDHFYNTYFHSAAMRFVEGGYTIRLNGINLFGHPFKQMDSSVDGFRNDISMIVDSAFVGYLVIRGLFWMLVILSWISFAHWKCLKYRDFRLLSISVIFLFLGTMERPMLDVWYNFVLLYPLAFITDKSNDPSDQLCKIESNENELQDSALSMEETQLFISDSSENRYEDLKEAEQSEKVDQEPEQKFAKNYSKRH